MMIKKIFLMILFLSIVAPVFAALTDGTNIGFVSSAPVDDPSGTSGVTDNMVRAGKFTAPEDATAIIEIGWWCDTATEEANFEVGIYSHDIANDEPETLLASSRTNAKGTTAGWKKATVNYTVIGGTIYWLAFQLDNTATDTSANFANVVGLRRLYINYTSTLPETYSTGTESANQTLAIYAIYTTVTESKVIVSIL